MFEVICRHRVLEMMLMARSQERPQVLRTSTALSSLRKIALSVFASAEKYGTKKMS
jgi:hypothetical protein